MKIVRRLEIVEYDSAKEFGPDLVARMDQGWNVHNTTQYGAERTDGVRFMVTYEQGY